MISPTDSPSVGSRISEQAKGPRPWLPYRLPDGRLVAFEPRGRELLTDTLVRAGDRARTAGSSSGVMRRAMANALFLDFSISESDDMRGTSASGHRPTTVNVISDATGPQRDKLRAFFDGLVRLSDADLDAVEAVVSRLAHADDDEDGQSVEELLAADDRRIRDRFVSELSPLRRDDALRLARKVGSDGESTLRRWEAERDIFSVSHHGQVYYPAFQFRGGLPNPIVKQVSQALPPHLSNWQRAFWFVSANGWVHNGAPADHLDDLPLLLRAARYEGEPVIG